MTRLNALVAQISRAYDQGEEGIYAKEGSPSAAPSEQLGRMEPHGSMMLHHTQIFDEEGESNGYQRFESS